MARPLRIEYPGAWYHIMNRGRRFEKIFIEEADYHAFPALLKETCEVCLITNIAMAGHYFEADTNRFLQVKMYTYWHG